MEQIENLIWGFFNNLLSFFFIVTFVVIGIIFAKKAISRFLFLETLKNRPSKNLTFLFIKIATTNEQKETAMEEFLRFLHRVLPNNTQFSLEMAATNQFLRFYIAIPKLQKAILEPQLYAQYPDAELEEVGDYLPDFGQNSAFAQLYFKKSSIFPIKTYHHVGGDLLKEFSVLFSRTEPGEMAFVQIALKRIGSKFWERGFSALQFRLFGQRVDAEGKLTPGYDKLSQDLFLGKVRLAYLAKDRITAQTKLNTILGVFKAVAGINQIKKKRFVLESNLDQAFKERIFEQGDFWTCGELVTLYHFPYKGSVISNIVRTISKRAPAPDILPKEGLVDPHDVSFFGETDYRNEKYKFGIKRADRRRHVYVVGKTGSGKSKLLELLLISDIQNGQGCCLLDPHGDLADEVLMFVPKERTNDVIYVNPSDRDFPIGFNPLEPVGDYQMRQHLATFFIDIFKKLFQATWNPRMEHLTRYITLALLETPDSNVLGIQRMLSDTTFRQRVIKQIEDPVVSNFWTNEFSVSNERFANDAVVPILNKVGQFVANPLVRNMVGQQKNVLNFEEFMNEGKIVLINISKGKLGEENSALLGSMFITKIQQAAMTRAKMREEERRDFYFYIDEFQNFATQAFSTILSEARKYRLNLTIAHQYIAQLPEDVKATAFGNVGSLIVFPVGGDDANYLAKEFAPVFSADDMINLNVRDMYIKMSVDGRVTQPFSGRTIDVLKPTFDYSVEIVDNSRMKYGRNRTQVENEIDRWTKSTEPVGSSQTTEDEFPEPII